MEKWLESVYSDGTKYFVSNPLPKRGEQVTIFIRMYEDAPVKDVIFRTKLNGVEQLISMKKARTENGLVYFSVEVTLYEDVLHYQFYLATDKALYYYTQLQITTYIPDETYDFKILVDYEQPEWVRSAVFYQIFPDRFYNGNPENDVKNGEYSFDGHKTQHIDNWNAVPEKYDKAFCLDFYGGDLEGIIQKIPYLKKLGITALYLNPIFYAATVHKYDCLDYFSVDPHLGGDTAFAELTKALHENGIRIILDVSINHTGIANKWFNRDGTFFDKSIGAYNNPDAKERNYYFFGDNNSYKAWWDTETLPTLNYTSPELRDIIYGSEDSLVKKWLNPPYNIDGWRFDVADTMGRNNEIQLHHEIWPEIRKSIKSANTEAYILAEDWSDCPEFLQGDEWDSPMNYYGCARPVREFLGDCDLFNRRHPSLRNIPYKMTARDLHSRIMEHLAKLPTVIQENQFNLLDSHDVPRLHNNPAVLFSEYRGAVIMLFTLPGGTNVYYGDEAEIDGRYEDVEGCRYPMPWNRDFEKGDYYHLYESLAHIKTGNEAFTTGGFKILSDDNYVFAYARFTAEQLWIAVCSTDDEEREIRLPIKAFGKTGFAKNRDVFGTAINAELKDGALFFRAAPHTSYLFEV
ncbi:hypothetical protein K7I13_01165 [Brucepastera parasyntrophica]|uniref:alpha-amylase family glycosyl hydrolase n=1 Tax=Brucepastera parasyntrophica TaxID=2880008 RepID=UPI00210C1522|nr:alpha-amylase family glycosyl hydrolase [Brucepastera parasyntrophica]ULQ59981.1 hypothetical protein K7I13_01165 [Brucepastera parasyntrophica]